MASDQSKRTYIIGWDDCGSLPLRLKEMDGGLRPDRPDRHFKTNHRLKLALESLYPSCPHMDRQIHGPGSYYNALQGRLFGDGCVCVSLV